VELEPDSQGHKCRLRLHPGHQAGIVTKFKVPTIPKTRHSRRSIPHVLSSQPFSMKFSNFVRLTWLHPDSDLFKVSKYYGTPSVAQHFYVTRLHYHYNKLYSMLRHDHAEVMILEKFCLTCLYLSLFCGNHVQTQIAAHALLALLDV